MSIVGLKVKHKASMSASEAIKKRAVTDKLDLPSIHPNHAMVQNNRNKFHNQASIN